MLQNNAYGISLIPRLVFFKGVIVKLLCTLSTTYCSDCIYRIIFAMLYWLSYFFFESKCLHEQHLDSKKETDK